MTSSNTPNTLLDLLEYGASSHAAIVVPDGPTVTYDSLRQQVRTLSEWLRAMGLGRDDRVAIVLPNGIEMLIGFLAVAATGTAAPLNAAYKRDEFEFYLADAGAKALITSKEVGEEADRAAPESITRIDATLDTNGQVDFATTQDSTGPGPGAPPDPDDVALVLHTSGTTSRPKRVPLTHRNLGVSARNIVDTYSLSDEDVSLCVMPLFHVHGLVASALSTFLSGGTVVVPTRFNAMGFWPMAQSHRATWYSAVPTMHQALLKRDRPRGTSEGGDQRYDGLRFIRSCSAPLASTTMLDMEDRFGVPVLEAYGMTEAAHQMASNPLPPGERRPGSVGPGTGVGIGIMDDRGTLLPSGERGEVVIQGSNVIEGYEDNPEANAASFSDGWFRTGDEGILDESGYLTIVGRIKEIINRSGEKISPVEIDEVLLTHPAVSEAVAFAVPHKVHGEEPAAAVVLSGEVTDRELIDHCRKHLADFKAPRVIHVVDAIPRTPTGKVQRRIVASAVTGQPPS